MTRACAACWRCSATRASKPKLYGTLTSAGGQYRAYGQRLDIEDGVLRFGGPIDNPTLDVLAVRPNLSQRVGVQITGTALLPRACLYAEPELIQVEARRARIYLNSYFEAQSEHDGARHIAENIADNDLTRAGLRRFSEAGTRPTKGLKRDREVRETEVEILRRVKSEMSPEELEQLKLLEQHEKRAAEFRKWRGK